jgi:small-conductance mechanosensitive channel
MFKNRSTIDVVVIVLACMVAFTIFTATLGTVLGKIVNPHLDVTRASEIISNTITTIVGALVGFIGGRAVGRNEANGEK